MKILNSRWFYAMPSILLAFLLWVYVGNDPNSVDTGTLRNIRVVFSGLEKLEERELIISEGVKQVVNLQLSARDEVWSRLNQGGTTVVVDVSGTIEPGEQSMAITLRNINFPYSVIIIDSTDVCYTSPSTIGFTVSRWSSKEIPIQDTPNGSAAGDFQRRGFSFAPDTIIVSGQEELVSQVDHAQITISQGDMNSTYSADCSYILIGTNGQPIVTGLVETESETALITLPVERMKEMELTVDLIPGGGATADNVTVDIEPRTLMVAGSAEIPDQLDRISLGEIDLSKIFGTSIQSMTINLDPFPINVSDITEAKATVTVEDLTIKTLEAGNIEIVNKSSGYEITRNAQSCIILIRGTQEAVDVVTASQVRIMADLSDLDLPTGNRTVPVKVYLDDSSEVDVVGECDISILVSRSRRSGESMVQAVKVTRVLADGRAEVVVKRQSAHGHGCSKYGGGYSGLIVSSAVTMIAVNPIRAAPGNMVMVESSTSRVLDTAVIVYLVPFLLFFTGYFLCAAFRFSSGVGTVVGVARFVLGLLLTALWDYRVYRQQAISFYITAIAPEA